MFTFQIFIGRMENATLVVNSTGLVIIFFEKEYYKCWKTNFDSYVIPKLLSWSYLPESPDPTIFLDSEGFQRNWQYGPPGNSLLIR